MFLEPFVDTGLGGPGTATGLAPVAFVTNSTELDEWSLGAVQEIDAAAMSLWVSMTT